MALLQAYKRPQRRRPKARAQFARGSSAAMARAAVSGLPSARQSGNATVGCWPTAVVRKSSPD